ncbi:MAG: restriction endonuclease subunit S [Bacteroidota bacterium]
MEQKLPENWAESRFSNLVSFVIGGDWGKDVKLELDDEYTEVLCIRGSEIKNWNYDKGSTAVTRKIKESSLEKRQLVDGDILLEISGGGPDQPVGRTIYIESEILKDIPIVCTNFLRLIRIHNTINKKYIYYYLQHFYFAGNIIKYQGGSNNLRNLKYKEFENILVPLPPLSEQQRIVQKLDQLFGELDFFKKRLERIFISLKNLKEILLDKAVIGDLTIDWRKSKQLNALEINNNRNENYFIHSLPETWKHSIISDLGNVKGGKRLPKGEKLVEYDTGYPYIRARDLKKSTVITDNVKFITSKIQRQIKNYTVNSGDLYMTIVGAKIGDTGIIPPEMDKVNLTENAAKITDLKEEYVFNKYLSFWLRSLISQKNIKESIMSAAQGKLALSRIKKLPVYLPPLKEQQEIVKRVDKLFKSIDSIEKRYHILKEKIDTLPQAILAKAFTGELVPQLDTDGDARDLLKEIEALNTAFSKKRKVKKK